jgi:hypothetical protein
MHQKSLAKRQAALRSVYDEAKSSMTKHKTGSTGNAGQAGPGWDSLYVSVLYRYQAMTN